MGEENKDKSENQSVKKPKSNRPKFQTLRILIIEPSGRYCRTVWCAVGNGITHILIGGTLISVLFYSLNMNDIHAVLCTFAVVLRGGLKEKNVYIFDIKFQFHFFSAEAILSLNYANGWSTPMRLRHRRFAHVFLQVCAMTCVVVGTVLVTTSEGLSGSVHGVTGLASALLAGITFLAGPCALLKGRYLKMFHTAFGIPTFIMSSISLCCGLFTSQFKSWASSAVIFILIGFIIFYTSFIVISCFIRCVMRL